MKINRLLLQFAFTFLCLLGTKSYSQHNPVIEGWYADPEGIKYGNTYWIFPTYSAPYKDQVFMDAFSSADLKTWKKHPRIIDTSAVKWAKKAMWAPAVLKKGNKYYIFFGANDIHPGEVGGIGVAVANKPDGPYKDLLGHPLIDTIVNGAQPIDQFVFRDKDGSHYMYYGGWGHCNVVKLKSDFSGIVPLPDGSLYKEITPEHYVEGPYMFIRNNKYYFMWSEGGWTGPDYKVAYAIADSPFGPFKRLSTVLEQDPKIARGAGHHSVIHSAKDDKYYIVYHRRPLDQTGANQRVICLDQMLFDKAGHILPVKMTFSWMAK